MTSVTKNPHPPTKKFFFECNLLDSFKPFNNSLAQSAEELGCW